MAEAIDANARNKVYFALAPRDAVDQARHLRPYLDDGDLIRLGGYEVVLRPVANGRVVPPVTADTEPPPKPIKGRSAELRKAAREHTGLPAKTRRELIGTAATARPAACDEPPVVGNPAELVGRNTFAVQPDRSLEDSNEPANERANGHEDAGEHAPWNPSYAHVTHDAEDWWTGTD
ncbi:hypothetical protein [Krasilnikovia sp. MM14-A1259]|uniref:hypothetical protein n=1 Tax=Krasilnikovia sp. MM14-A1259 TaxID=3373539 RepID=UPI0037FDACC3